MAQKVVVELVDDIDGSLIEDGKGEHITFFHIKEAVPRPAGHLTSGSGRSGMRSALTVMGEPVRMVGRTCFRASKRNWERQR